MLRLIVRAPRADGFRDDELKSVRTWQDVSGTICARAYTGRGANWMRWPGVVVFRFDHGGTVDAFPERTVDPSWIVDLFRRTVEPLVLQTRGWETLHASAILASAGVVAFCGERQAGKSTLAYAFSRRGYEQFADDMIVIGAGAAEPRVLARPFGVRLRSEPAAFFGFEPDGRHFQDVTPLPSETEAVVTQPLRGICVLGRTPSGEPSIERCSPGDALAALVEQSYCFDPQGDRTRLLKNYLHIAATVPVYAVRFADGLQHVESVLNALERSLPDLVRPKADATSEEQPAHAARS
jgi:hypothetical protein